MPHNVLHQSWHALKFRLGRFPGVRELRTRKEVVQWLRNTKPGPAPHLVKQANLRLLASRYQIPTLVETGTYLGDMVAAMRGSFQRVISIELSPLYHRRALRRFCNVPGVELKLGDSGEVLAELCCDLAGPVLFWLDGHYSGGTTARGALDSPIVQELDAIFSNPQITPYLVIDDARLFVGQDGYPTIDALEKHLQRLAPGTHLSIHDDAIVVLPPRAILLQSRPVKRAG